MHGSAEETSSAGATPTQQRGEAGAGAAPLGAGVVVRQIARYLRPVTVLLVVAALLLLSNRAMLLSVPRLAGAMINNATAPPEDWSLGRDSALLGGIFVLIASCQFVAMTLFGYVGERLALAIRSGVFSHLTSLSLEFFHRRRTGELLSRLASDATMIQAIGTTLPVHAMTQMVTLVGGVVMVAFTSAHLALLMFAFLPGIVLITLTFGRRIRRLSTELLDTMASSTTVVEEALTGIETVKTCAREEHEVARYDGRLAVVLRTGLRLAVARAGHAACATLLFYGGLVGLLAYAVGMMGSGDLSVGDLVSFMMYTMLVGTSLAGMTQFWGRWQQLLGSGRRIFQILQEEASVVDRDGAAAFDGKHSEIVFDRVCFSYPDHADQVVLHDLSFSIHHSEVIALVGESGAGKSTIASLLLRHFDVTSGAIRIDGRDLRDLRQRDLRRSIAMVPQDVIVFGRSLRENIAYGRLDATEEEIVAAARAAHALEFIERAPDGLDTLAGDRGVMLSGGERQRIAIARALLANPAILILDEATSSLDNESERLVKQALERLVATRTTLVIAHRLSTIERADRVLVVHDGRLVESGTHSELLARDGRYARLARSGVWGQEPA